MPIDLSALRQSWPLPRAPRPIVIVGAGGIVNDAHLPAYRLAGLPVALAYLLFQRRVTQAITLSAGIKG